MKSVAPAIKVGLTVLVVTALGYWAFMLVAKGTMAGKKEQLHLHAYFKDATLLVEKSRVQVAGINIGFIESAELNTGGTQSADGKLVPLRRDLVTSKRFARVTVSLDPSKITLYSNAAIYKRSASLLGEFYLEIDPGTYEWTDRKGVRHVNERLKDGDEILNVGEASTVGSMVNRVNNEILPTVRDLVNDVRKFTTGPLTEISKNINDGIGENRAAIRHIVTNMELITRDIRAVTAGSGGEVKQILGDIKSITGSVREMVADKDSGASIKEGITKLTSAIDKLDKAMGQAEGIADDVHDVTSGLAAGKGTVGRLLKDEKLIDDVEDTVREAGTLIKSITQLQTVVGLRSEYNFRAGSIKTYLTVELHPRPDKYYLIELIDDPRGRRNQRTTITRSDDPSRPLLTREDTVTVSDSFRLTFQFAKRIKFATFRFGIKESTGGIGADFKFFNDRVQIWTDVFDFQANVFPRLKVQAAWEFYKRMYITGGIDDAFNDRPQDGTGGGRDFFVGAQLRFNDRDLRQLLLVGGSALSGVVQ